MPRFNCIWCQQPIYYSWAVKAHAHEGNRPSKVAAQRGMRGCLPSTWAKWIPCEDANGNLMGTNATYEPEPNTEGAGI